MVDVVDKQTRSRMMAGIQGKNTRPEIMIRKALFKSGFRYRLHYPRLPGKPDLVLPKYRAIILINGCFWHGHMCHLFKWPQTRNAFWKKKIEGNIERDRKNRICYQQLGWRTLTVWECALKGRYRLSFEEVVDAIEAWIEHGNEAMEITGNGQQ